MYFKYFVVIHFRLDQRSFNKKKYLGYFTLYYKNSFRYMHTIYQGYIENGLHLRFSQLLTNSTSTFMYSDYTCC